MTMTVIILNLAMWLPAVFVLMAAAARGMRPGPDLPIEEGRAEWRGPFDRQLDGRRVQRTAASIATATNSSAR
jgi:hypothetical protein